MGDPHELLQAITSPLHYVRPQSSDVVTPLLFEIEWWIRNKVRLQSVANTTAKNQVRELSGATFRVLVDLLVDDLGDNLICLFSRLPPSHLRHTYDLRNTRHRRFSRYTLRQTRLRCNRSKNVERLVYENVITEAPPDSSPPRLFN